MLSDAELWRAFTPSGVYMDATLTKLRAVEAAVRADQIEKDAVIAEGIRSDRMVTLQASPYGLSVPVPPAPAGIAAAIRAQLDDR